MYELIHADCRNVLANMGDNSVDSIVTDPPYHLTSIVKRFGGKSAAPAQFGSDGAFARASRGFMGQTWDGGDIAFDPELWAECWRVLKPGGHLLAFSGTRTYHRMAVAIEDAGFEIRDMLSWLYASGFPKSLDVSKAFDKAAATDAAKQWAGWGTALKPACEPICFARKPLIGTVAENVAAYGVGAINIDACRVPAAEGDDPVKWSTPRGGICPPNSAARGTLVLQDGLGRFPANVMHDGSDEVLAGFPVTTSGGYPAAGRQRAQNAVYGTPNETGEQKFTQSSGSVARFFYCAKASKADREIGCGNLPVGPTGAMAGNLVDGQRLGGDGRPIAVPQRANIHPTVKPTELMRWLVRLVTPRGGVVFDPFTGSGSTGRAAILEGCRFIGAEMTAEYIPIARARIDAAVNGQ